jgi:hypothetical protein
MEASLKLCGAWWIFAHSGSDHDRSVTGGRLPDKPETIEIRHRPVTDLVVNMVGSRVRQVGEQAGELVAFVQ